MTLDNEVPVIRFEKFSDEWEERELKSIFNIIRNAFVGTATPYYVDKGHFYLESNNVKNGQINRNIEIFINDEFYKKQSDKWLRTGDIVMVQSGHVGHTAVIPPKLDKIAAHALIIFTSPKEQINPYFFNFQFQTIKSKNKLLKVTTGNTIKHILSSEMKEFKVFKPEFKEQTKIGNYFQQLDTLITQHQQKHDKLLNIKKALLEKMFPKQGEDVPEIRFKGFSGEWTKKVLGEDVADIVGGGTPSTQIPEYWNGDIHWYSPTEIGRKVYAEKSEKQITEEGLDKSSAKILPANRTVLFTSRAGIGDMAILSSAGCTNQGFQSIVLKNGYDTYFLYSVGFQIKDYAMSHASGSTFLEISGKQLEKMDIKVPLIEEQTKIGKLFKNCDQLITQHQTQLKKLKNIKQACLEKMFV